MGVDRSFLVRSLDPWCLGRQARGCSSCGRLCPSCCETVAILCHRCRAGRSQSLRLDPPDGCFRLISGLPVQRQIENVGPVFLMRATLCVPGALRAVNQRRKSSAPISCSMLKTAPLVSRTLSKNPMESSRRGYLTAMKIERCDANGWNTNCDYILLKS